MNLHRKRMSLDELKGLLQIECGGLKELIKEYRQLENGGVREMELFSKIKLNQGLIEGIMLPYHDVRICWGVRSSTVKFPRTAMPREIPDHMSITKETKTLNYPDVLLEYDFDKECEEDG